MVLLAWNFFRVLGRCCDGKGLQDFASILSPCFPCAVPILKWGPHLAQWSLAAAFCQGTCATKLSQKRLVFISPSACSRLRDQRLLPIQPHQRQARWPQLQVAASDSSLLPWSGSVLRSSRDSVFVFLDFDGAVSSSFLPHIKETKRVDSNWPGAILQSWSTPATATSLAPCLLLLRTGTRS